MKCPHCSEEHEDGLRYCPKTNKQISHPPPTWLILTIFSVIVCCLLAFVLAGLSFQIIEMLHTKTPTPSITYTITNSPTFTVTPSITLSPSVTVTSSVTSTVTPLLTITPTVTDDPKISTSSCTLLLGQAVHVAENARIWSFPDVNKAESVTSLPTGSITYIIGEPVFGPIYFNKDVSGWWWEVSDNQDGESIGWIWEGRIKECN